MRVITFLSLLLSGCSALSKVDRIQPYAVDVHDSDVVSILKDSNRENVRFLLVGPLLPFVPMSMGGDLERFDVDVRGSLRGCPIISCDGDTVSLIRSSIGSCAYGARPSIEKVYLLKWRDDSSWNSFRFSFTTFWRYDPFVTR